MCGSLELELWRMMRVNGVFLPSTTLNATTLIPPTKPTCLSRAYTIVTVRFSAIQGTFQFASYNPFLGDTRDVSVCISKFCVWNFRNVDYKVLRASTGSLSPLGNVPPPEQNTETRGTNTKTGPFVWAESGKDEIASNKNGVMKVKG
jgi:hypothetical protein